MKILPAALADKRMVTASYLLLASLVLSGLSLTSCTSTDTPSATASADQADAKSDELDEMAQVDGADAAPAAKGGDAVAEKGEIPSDLADDELGMPATGPKELSIPEAKTVAPPVPEEKPVAPTEVAVNDIQYVSKKNGGTVVIETSAPATYHTREVPAQSQVILEIANAQLPDKLKHPFVTKDFNQAINSINAYQDKGSSTVRVVVQFKEPTHAVVRQDGAKLVLAPNEIASEIDGHPTLGGPAGAEVTAGAGEAFEASAQKPGGEAFEASAQKPGDEASQPLNDQDPRILAAKSIDDIEFDNAKYYGRPISIEVRDMPVREVINIIAEQSGANIVLGADVDGNVTLKLRKIPWDEALLIIMKTRNLGYVRQGSILRIEPYAALQKETTQARLVVEAQRMAEPLRVKVIPLGYARAMDIEKQLVPFLTPNRGKVVPDQRTNALVVTDIPEVIERIGSLIKALDIAPLQVLIEGKVVEATDAFTRNLGITWGYGGNPINVGSQTLTQGFQTNMTLPGAGVFNLNVGQFDVFGNIQATIGLAEQENIAHVVSSPRVVAINNEQATIVQGTNIPIATVTSVNGATSQAYSYTSVEMRLDVTPQVTSENDVIMLVKLKRDFQSGASVGAGLPPPIDHREAATRVLVRNGQTAVIGGVYQNDMSTTESGLPWLRDLPVIGWLFKTRGTQKTKAELLVFLTPRILNADTASQKEGML